MQETNFDKIILEKTANDPTLATKDLSRYKRLLLEQIKLIQQTGWDYGAITTFMDLFIADLKQSETDELLNPLLQNTFLVGSKPYEKMLEGSQMSDKSKVILVIDHLGGFLDENGDLQLSKSVLYQFDPQMTPGASFLDKYAKLVQSAYPNGLVIEKDDKKLSKTAIKKKYPAETKIHQFRNQLDRHNIKYIRRFKEAHDLKSDEQAIKCLLGKNWFYADPQYHNRAYLNVDIGVDDLQKTSRTLRNRGLVKKLRKRGFYRKILSADYHSEFIIDEDGQLLSQWLENNEISDYRELTIANGESFNYGERPRVDPFKSHDKLDGTPPRYFDTDERNRIKKNWISPTDNWFYQLLRRLAEFGIRYKKIKIKE
ncbi:DUF3114 domain-containing protein [Enterococcus sp. 5H]|uniref:DUF3114 domain-containing protein n=1 Tax=Enterococcus sp. 5H TaxID=1229490 RepID=UPI002301FF01|nr:DUF3114 domain-containing protein [Enterococcus sp. 5H]MDA9472269.1 hypothetical protein [Enterococcus sp. 5H]